MDYSRFRCACMSEVLKEYESVHICNTKERCEGSDGNNIHDCISDSSKRYSVIKQWKFRFFSNINTSVFDLYWKSILTVLTVQKLFSCWLNTVLNKTVGEFCNVWHTVLNTVRIMFYHCWDWVENYLFFVCVSINMRRIVCKTVESSKR